MITTRLTAILLLSAGCVSIPARSLTSLPLHTDERVAGATARRVTVGAFVDARGKDFARARQIPIIEFFHQSGQLFYPEVAGILRGSEHHKPFVTTGSLDGALPSLLVQTMHEMQLSPAVALDTHAEGSDYFVTGRLTRSALRHDTMPVAAVALGLFGVPFKVVRFELEYEIAVYRAGEPRPILQRTYQNHGKRVVGLYYNHEAGYSLLMDSLQKTLPQVVKDVAQAITGAEAKAKAMIPPRA